MLTGKNTIFPSGLNDCVKNLIRCLQNLNKAISKMKMISLGFIIKKGAGCIKRYSIENSKFSTGSGSGSGAITLNQRTIANDLVMLEVVARGRYKSHFYCTNSCLYSG